MENDEAAAAVERLVGMREGTEWAGNDEVVSDSAAPAPRMGPAADTWPPPDTGARMTAPLWKPICVGTRGV